MAIDTAEKRQNLVGVARPWMRSQYPTGSPDAEWRASVGLAYGGGFPVVFVPPAPQHTIPSAEDPIILPWR